MSKNLKDQQIVSESDLWLRDMLSDDITPVVNLERNVQVSPWSRLSFEESLTKGSVCRVIEAQEQIVAYHVTSVAADELHILNLVVAKPQQGIGLGHRLMQDIMEQAKASGSQKVFLEVRESNLVAQGLYTKWQFRQIAIRKNYYRVPNDVGVSSRENALVYVREHL